MISRSDGAAAERRGRVLRIAIAASVFVHLLAVLVAFGVYDALDRLLVHHVVRQRKLDDETVTLSTAIHIEKRARAAATHAGRTSILRRTPRSEQAARPEPQVALVAKPLPQQRNRQTIAKAVPHATPVPVAARIPATSPPTSAPPAREHPLHATLSATRLAQIQSDLATSIAKDRARDNPLSNVAHRVKPASTMRRYTMNVAGRNATLNGAQGLCTPLRTWTAGGYVYFNVTCRTQHPDGSVRNEVIPWPLRFRPDQISYGADGPAPPPGQIPLPPSGWKPPASQYIDPDVINFLRENGYAV